MEKRKANRENQVMEIYEKSERDTHRWWRVMAVVAAANDYADDDDVLKHTNF